MQAAREGDRARANELLRAVVDQDPDHEEALLWLAALAEDPEQSIVYLQRVLDINPRNARAQAGLRWAREQMQAGETRAQAPTEPAWGGTVELMPLEPERTEWRLSTVVGLVGVLLLIGGLVWWVSSIFPLVKLPSPAALITEPEATTSRSPTGTLPPPTVTAIAAHTSSASPSAGTAPPAAAIATDTPSSLPATATATAATAVPTVTPSPVSPTATITGTPSVTPSPTVPTAAVTATPTVTPSAVPPTATRTCTATPSPVPTPATVWPTPGPTTAPQVTPAPTPLSRTAAETTPALLTPGPGSLPGRG